MRLDHIAYRVSNRYQAAEFMEKALRYRISTEFEIPFEDGSKSKCLVLAPIELKEQGSGRKNKAHVPDSNGLWHEFHLAPEVFISDGTPDSVVGKWVATRNGVGGIHHIAYEIYDVESEMDRWRKSNFATFSSSKPIEGPGITQVFTDPHPITGVIYELIHRKDPSVGFNPKSVQQLMLSTDTRL